MYCGVLRWKACIVFWQHITLQCTLASCLRSVSCFTMNWTGMHAPFYWQHATMHVSVLCWNTSTNFCCHTAMHVRVLWRAVLHATLQCMLVRCLTLCCTGMHAQFLAAHHTTMHISKLPHIVVYRNVQANTAGTKPFCNHVH